MSSILIPSFKKIVGAVFEKIKGVGGGLGVKILFDLVATYFKNLGYREVGTFYRIEKANPVAKF